MQRRTLATAAAAGAFLPAIVRAQLGADRYRFEALAGGAFLLRSSQLAESRASSPLVRQFATFEAAEQIAITDAAAVAGFGSGAAATPLSADKAAALQALTALRGAEFDRAYVRDQLAAHREALIVYRSLATGGGKEDRIIATLAVATIEQHIEQLRGIEAALRG